MMNGLKILPQAGQVIDNGTDAFVKLDNDWRYSYVSPQAEILLQHPSRELVGSNRWRVFPDTVGTMLDREYHRAVSEQTPVAFEYFHAAFNQWFEVHASPSPDGLSVYFHDITERKRIEEKLAYYASIVDSCGDAIIGTDLDRKITSWNDGAERLYGYSTDEAVGQSLSLIIPPEFQTEASQVLERIVLGERLEHFETIRMNKNRDRLCVSLTISPIKDISGEIVGASAVGRDITGRKAAELQESAARERMFLRDVLASVTEGRLNLCDCPSQLPVPFPETEAPISLSMEGGVGDLRHCMQKVAAAAGLSEEQRFDFEIAVGEAGINAVVHTGAGQGQVSSDLHHGKVQVRIEDHGKGIAVENLPRATLARGYSTKATLGHGFKIILQTADRISLYTAATGTTIVLEKSLIPMASSWLC